MSCDLQVYLAAVYTNSYMPGGNRYPKLNEREQQIMAEVKQHNILESYHYVLKDTYVQNMRENGAKVFLDSGAFSAWSLGATINIEDYVNYIIRNQDIIRVEDGNLMASVLDAIGSAQGTFENQMAMERMGVRPLPCFHKYEDERYLEWYVKRYDYITIGGMVGTPTPVLVKWLDHIWDKYLTDGSGNPRIKVHGFGITAVPVMERYPWYSCDSSSWIQAAAFGSIYTAKHGPLPVSAESPAKHNLGRHIETLSPIEREYVENMLVEQGFDRERLSTVYESRAVYNMYAYMEVNRMINEQKVNHKLNMTQGLF
ncbi:putative queuine tRNA ribosyltransferase [Vibrio phage pVco-14]|nr:putative queuine tRNA ribosyltransferase [Vibrio phage pVco-14]